jgi:hypothetical protein
MSDDKRIAEIFMRGMESPEVGQGANGAVVGDARGSEGSLVDRLAARWADSIGGEDDETSRRDARFFLLAIADELAERAWLGTDEPLVAYLRAEAAASGSEGR